MKPNNLYIADCIGAACDYGVMVLGHAIANNLEHPEELPDLVNDLATGLESAHFNEGLRRKAKQIMENVTAIFDDPKANEIFSDEHWILVRAHVRFIDGSLNTPLRTPFRVVSVAAPA